MHCCGKTFPFNNYNSHEPPTFHDDRMEHGVVRPAVCDSWERVCRGESKRPTSSSTRHQWLTWTCKFSMFNFVQLFSVASSTCYLWSCFEHQSCRFVGPNLVRVNFHNGSGCDSSGASSVAWKDLRIPVNVFILLQHQIIPLFLKVSH